MGSSDAGPLRRKEATNPRNRTEDRPRPPARGTFAGLFTAQKRRQAAALHNVLLFHGTNTPVPQAKEHVRECWYANCPDGAMADCSHGTTVPL